MAAKEAYIKHFDPNDSELSDAETEVDAEEIAPRVDPASLTGRAEVELEPPEHTTTITTLRSRVYCGVSLMVSSAVTFISTQESA